jgi:hypothetical protein
MRGQFLCASKTFILSPKTNPQNITKTLIIHFLEKQHSKMITLDMCFFIHSTMRMQLERSTTKRCILNRKWILVVPITWFVNRIADIRLYYVQNCRILVFLKPSLPVVWLHVEFDQLEHKTLRHNSYQVLIFTRHLIFILMAFDLYKDVLITRILSWILCTLEEAKTHGQNCNRCSLDFG